MIIVCGNSLSWGDSFNCTSVFLLPHHSFMYTAQLVDSTIERMHQTPFPSGQRYALSAHGLAACIDRENKVIHYGFIQEDGQMTGHQMIDYPEMIHPDCVVIVDEYLVFGGRYVTIDESDDEEGKYFTELIATYSVVEKVFKPVYMPHRKWGKSVDDLLLDGSKIIAVDDIVVPKFMIDYDFSDPGNPRLIADHDLASAGPNETIKKGTLNAEYVALLSVMMVQTGVYQSIALFIKGHYDTYCSVAELLRQWESVNVDFPHLSESETSPWLDILWHPTENVLLIAAMERGIGILSLEEGDIPTIEMVLDEEEEEEEEMEVGGTDEDTLTARIRYVKPADWKVKKLIAVGNDVLAIGEESGQVMRFAAQ